MIRGRLVFAFALILAFFLDPQVSTVLTEVVQNRWFLVTQLLLLVLFYQGLLFSSRWNFASMVVLGLFFDSYYLLDLGYGVYLFPLIFFVSRRLRGQLLVKKWLRFASLLVLQTLFPILLYQLGLTYETTTYLWDSFLNQQILPSFILNSFLTLIAFNKLDSLFLKVLQLTKYH